MVSLIALMASRPYDSWSAPSPIKSVFPSLGATIKCNGKQTLSKGLPRPPSDDAPDARTRHRSPCKPESANVHARGATNEASQTPQGPYEHEQASLAAHGWHSERF